MLTGKLSFISRIRLPIPRTRKWVIIGLVILLFIALSGSGAYLVYRRPDSQGAQRVARLLPYPAAFVGSRIVWVSEVFAQERFTATYGEKTNQVIPESPAVRGEILDHLVEIALVSGETARHNIQVSQEEIESSFATIAQQNGGEEQILATLRELYGMSEREFKSLMADQLLIDKFKQEILVTASVRHILVKDQAKANELVTKLREGADFAATAKEFSEDTGSRDAGGSLGFVGRGTTVKPFEDAAFSLEVGKVSDPVQSEFGWHIILVEERKGIIDQSYGDWLAEAKANTRIVRLLTR